MATAIRWQMRRQRGSYESFRLGTTQDIANAVAFLASEDSSYITATELVVDGGLTQV